MKKLSVVIIGRNEETYIGRTVSAVLKATETIPSTEIVYVDSASSDETVSIVSRYPVRILRLKESRELSSAAGRYIGYMNTSGSYVLFVDGDTLIYRKWPEQGMKFLENHPQAGGTAGILHELFTNENGAVIRLKKNRYGQQPGITRVRMF